MRQLLARVVMFLPMAGYYWDSNLKYDFFDGRYWSSTQHSSYSYDAYYLRVSIFNSVELKSNNRGYGLTVRPIAK